MFKFSNKLIEIPLSDDLASTDKRTPTEIVQKEPRINPLSAKLDNLNFHPLQAVSRYRDPQL